jgi:hypothetical protein
MLQEAQHPISPEGAASPIPIVAAEEGPAGHTLGRTEAESSPACRMGPAASSPAPGTSPGRAGLAPSPLAYLPSNLWCPFECNATVTSSPKNSCKLKLLKGFRRSLPYLNTGIL